MDISSWFTELMNCQAILRFLFTKLTKALTSRSRQNKPGWVRSYKVWTLSGETATLSTRKAWNFSKFTRNQTASTNVRALLLLINVAVYLSTYSVSFTFVAQQLSQFNPISTGKLESKLCGLDEKPCVDSVHKKMPKITTSCNCLERCEAVSYEFTLSHFPLWGLKDFHDLNLIFLFF